MNGLFSDKHYELQFGCVGNTKLPDELFINDLTALKHKNNTN